MQSHLAPYLYSARLAALVVCLYASLGDTDYARCSAHPSAPNKPPFETLLGFLEAPMDKVIDAFEAFPKDEEMKEAKEELKHRDHDAVAERAAAAK